MAIQLPRQLVQSVKRVLRVTLHEKAPQVETLRIAIISRPLTHLQVSPDDPEPIAPNHFLLGGPNASVVPDPAGGEPTATRKQWQICRGLTRRFWKLLELTKRSKHYADQPPLRIDDLVYICGENIPRSQWQRGLVIGVHTGPDGVVRTATIVDVREVECRQLIVCIFRSDMMCLYL